MIRLKTVLSRSSTIIVASGSAGEAVKTTYRKIVVHALVARHQILGVTLVRTVLSMRDNRNTSTRPSPAGR